MARQSVVRRVVAWLAAVVMARVVVLVFLMASWPGFIISKDTPHPATDFPLSGSYSCSGTASGVRGGTTTSTEICTPAR
jgi:hypothetical protein